MPLRLYSYWRSTTSYRVRIALALKGVAYETISINLVDGAQRLADYKALNPVAGVPTLVLENGEVLTQSMAILEWVEAAYPNPALLPNDPIEAAHVRAAALVFATDVHPVNNLKVVGKLKSMGHDQEIAIAWMRDWMAQGFEAFEALIRPDTPFAFGDQPDLADICLVAQLYNGHRWGCDLSKHPRLTEIEAKCLALPAFAEARPEAQPDAT